MLNSFTTLTEAGLHAELTVSYHKCFFNFIFIFYIYIAWYPVSILEFLLVEFYKKKRKKNLVLWTLQYIAPDAFCVL